MKALVHGCSIEHAVCSAFAQDCLFHCLASIILSSKAWHRDHPYVNKGENIATEAPGLGTLDKRRGRPVAGASE